MKFAEATMGFDEPTMRFDEATDQIGQIYLTMAVITKKVSFVNCSA